MLEDIVKRYAQKLTEQEEQAIVDQLPELVKDSDFLEWLGDHYTLIEIQEHGPEVDGVNCDSLKDGYEATVILVKNERVDKVTEQIRRGEFDTDGWRDIPEMRKEVGE